MRLHTNYFIEIRTLGLNAGTRKKETGLRQSPSCILGIYRFRVLGLIPFEPAPADQHLLLLIIEPQGQ